MNPPIISIVGKSGAGKTRLIELLIPALKALGIKTATLKHDAHRFDIDHEGKDTWRHFQAGSETVAIASAEKLAVIKRLDGPMSPDEIISRYISDADLVITEGYKRGDKPKIEVHRRDVSGDLLCSAGDNLAAVVTDEPLDVECRSFSWDDVESLARFIVDTFLPGPR